MANFLDNILPGRKVVTNVPQRPISNTKQYLRRMQKSLLDKMFFIDKVFEPFSNIIDFGCANGELIKTLRSLFPDHRYIGYDTNEEMIAAAKTNVSGVKFISNWNDADVDFSDTLLNLSSVIHEVYSYSTKEDIELFWQRVFGSGFKYIAIRDMAVSNKESWAADGRQLNAVKNNISYLCQLVDYEAIWGEIHSERDLVHFLLKYRYDDNWDREVRENYLPLSYEELLGIIPEDYEVLYSSHYTLPYLQWQVKKDFSIDLNTPTHVKLILKRKEKEKESRENTDDGSEKGNI